MAAGSWQGAAKEQRAPDSALFSIRIGDQSTDGEEQEGLASIERIVNHRGSRGERARRDLRLVVPRYR